MKKNLLFPILFLAISVLSAQQTEAVKPDHVRGEILFKLVDNQSFNDLLNFLVSNKNSSQLEGTYNIFKTKTAEGGLEISGHGFGNVEGQMNGFFIIKTVASLFGIHSLSFDADLNDEKILLKTLQRHPSVKSAQFNHNIQLRGNPNDPLFPQQWYLPKINAPSVWDKTTGGVTACGDTIVVAVIDAGFYDKTADLLPNLWVNKGEIPNNGIDDDANGFIDDFRGRNVQVGRDTHSVVFNIQGFGESAVRHGTKAAGVLGAKGNNGQSISGINWNIKIMLLSGNTSVDFIMKSYEYILKQRQLYDQTNGQKGAFVAATSMSIGQSGKTPSEVPLWCEIYAMMEKSNILNFTSASNTEADATIEKDMPALCNRPNLFVVSGTDEKDNPQHGFSSKFIHLAAPSENMVVLSSNNGTENDSGTSFATPLVAGAAALLWSIQDGGRFCQLAKTDGLTAMNALKDVLLRGSDKPSGLANKNVANGRLNLKRSYDLLLRRTGQPIGDYDVLKLAPNPVDRTLQLTFQLPEMVSANIVVVNMLGQIVYDKQITDADLLKNPFTLDTRQLAAGLYVVGVRTKDFEVTRKFVVAHP